MLKLLVLQYANDTVIVVETEEELIKVFVVRRIL